MIWIITYLSDAVKTFIESDSILGHWVNNNALCLKNTIVTQFEYSCSNFNCELKFTQSNKFIIIIIITIFKIIYIPIEMYVLD